MRWLAVLALVAAAPAGAAAKPKPITGTLPPGGYTVLAIGAGGKATVARVARRTFSVTPPSTRASLQLRAPNGVYAGPVVVGRSSDGKRALLGVRAGAKLGRLAVGAGYFKPVRRTAARWIDKSWYATARRGVPIGARNFGLVRVAKLRGPAIDRDLDGVPTPLDVDDDGDLVLDNVDRSAPARAARDSAVNQLAIGSHLALPITGTVNADAGSTIAHSDTAMTQFQRIGINSPVAAPELDCVGLSYCSLGGTGVLWGTTEHFPECCDLDHDGLGTAMRPDASGALVPVQAGPLTPMVLVPGATSAQIHTGDELVERVDGTQEAFPTTLNFVFASSPALDSYSDTAADGATIDYNAFEGGGAAAAGTGGNGFAVAPGADGHIRLTLTFWRPQRAWTSGDPGAGGWMDVGGLIYQLNIGTAECGPTAYSESDASLEMPPAGSLTFELGGAGGVVDTAPDRPADRDRRLTFTVDLTDCLTGHEQLFDQSGDELFVALHALAAGGGETEQQFWVRRA